MSFGGNIPIARFIAAILFLIFLIAVAFDVQSGHNGPVFLNALFVLLYGCPHLHVPSIH